MGKTIPPTELDLASLPYDPMYAANGEVVMTANGKIASAKLTTQQEEQIIRLVLEGKPIYQIARELRTTAWRVSEYLSKPKANAAIQHRALTVNLVESNRQMAEQMVVMAELIAVMERRISSIQTQLYEVKKLSYRQKQGRFKAERENRSQRVVVNKLRRDIWKRTGKEPF